jgi:tetratricopeptide (TPR) repeat protein
MATAPGICYSQKVPLAVRQTPAAGTAAETGFTMADTDSSLLPNPSPEHRRVAAGQYERANQVLASGNHDYAIQLLLTCCKLDPANLVYRQTLRKTERVKYKNNLRGSRLAFLTTSASKTKLMAAKASRDYPKVLECGEEVLARNPWDVGTQMDMAEAAEALGLADLAVWLLEQARYKNPQDTTVNRALARLHEKRGNFKQAIALWELVRKAEPRDIEAQHKGKDLAASHTIAKGNYEAAVKPEAAEGVQAGKESKPAAAPPSDASVEIPVVGPREPREAPTLRARIAADPTNANAYLHLAGVYRRAEQYDRAREVLQQGLGPSGNNFDIMIELTDLEIEPFRQNLTITEEKLRTRSADEELRKIRIRLLKEINTRELDLFRRKADRFPTDMGNRLELGVRLLRAGQSDAAILELQAARNDPRYRWKALLYLGYCFKSRNNWRLAERNFEEALGSLPAGEEASRKELLFQLAQGAAESGDLGKAVDLAYDLANRDFGYRDIGKLLDEWQARLQKA